MRKWVLNFLGLTTILSIITFHLYYQYYSNLAIKRKTPTDQLKAIHPILRDRLFVSHINGSNNTGITAIRNISLDDNLTMMYFPIEQSHSPQYFSGDRLPTYKENRVSSELLPRRLDMKLEKQLFQLVLEVTSMMTSHGISFTMAHGMLLGSYIFHNMIPWDDDLDLYIDIKDINNLKAMFRTDQFKRKFAVHSYWEKDMYSEQKLKEETPWSNTYSCGSGAKKGQKCYQQGKVYFKKSARAGRQAWNYPFFDFTFYKNNGTHVFNHDNWKTEPKVILPVDEFYPLILRPIDSYWLPAPKNTLQVLKYKFKQFQCKGGHWDHVHEKRPKGKAATVNCDKLKVSYPYVRRRKYLTQNGTEVTNKVIEDLMLADMVLHSVVVDGNFTKANILALD